MDGDWHEEGDDQGYAYDVSAQSPSDDHGYTDNENNENWREPAGANLRASFARSPRANDNFKGERPILTI